jgi:thioredoxin 1
MPRSYLPEQLTRDDVDRLPGLTVLQFGTDWCGYCTAAEPAIEQALGGLEVSHYVLVEDGSRRPLGRSFRVKLWPTLIFLIDGVEVARSVRPWKLDDLAEPLAQVAAAHS